MNLMEELMVSHFYLQRFFNSISCVYTKKYLILKMDCGWKTFFIHLTMVAPQDTQSHINKPWVHHVSLDKES